MWRVLLQVLARVNFYTFGWRMSRNSQYLRMPWVVYSESDTTCKAQAQEVLLSPPPNFQHGLGMIHGKAAGDILPHLFGNNRMGLI